MIEVLLRVAESLSGQSEITVTMEGANPRSPDDFVRSELDVAFLVTNNTSELLVGHKLTNITFVLAGKRGLIKEKKTAENCIS